MKVARLTGPGRIEVGEEALPVAGDGETLIRVRAVGLCGSDLHWHAEGGIGDAVLTRPLVLGHEFAGTVDGGPRAGKRVAVDPAIPCQRCHPCRSGHRNLCPSVRFAGHGDQDGALRQYLTWPTALLHPLPDTISDADGAMLEPLGVAIHAVDLGHVRLGYTVAVVGCGPIGLLLIQAARAAGATSVVAVDPLAHRRAAARAMGADWAGEGTPDGVAEALAGHGGVDTAFEVAGVDAAVMTAMELVRPGGRVVLAGIPDDDRTSFRASLARRKGLTIVLVRRMPEVYPRAIALVEQGRVDVRSVVTGSYPLEATAEAFDAAAARRGLKVVVEPVGSA